jgi:hypothetical protein
MMTASTSALQALLRGAIDYAGLFPPARLDMATTVANYSRYRLEPEGWMLGRLVCPAARLQELAPWHEEMRSATPPWRLAVLGRGGDSVASFLTNLRTDLEEMAAFRAQTQERVLVDVYEVKVPTRFQGSGEAASWLSQTYDLLERLGPPVVTPFFEASPGNDGTAQHLTPLLAALAEEEFSAAAESRLRVLPGGFKLRCGGLEASAFPSAATVAAVLAACRDDDLPVKFTAGLHHPLPRRDSALGVTMHGFVNVLLAALFAYLADWTEEELETLLQDDNPSHFHFNDEAWSWQGHALTAAQIADLRAECGLTFGSCSFDEPRDDLRSLGWLPG